MQYSPATPTPSVLTHVPDVPSPYPLEAFGMSSSFAESSSPTSRRQRISMACQYCRHRKIRCCGGAPCRNCQRSQRECEYAPVPEEVNRATREKKAIAKATKPMIQGYSPYSADTPVFDVPYTTHALRPTGLGHRRSVSVPNFTFVAPPAPALSSPPMFESPQWMYNGWTAPQQSPVFPSVFEQAPPAPPSHSPLPTSWSTPNIQQHASHLRPPVPLTPLSTANISPTTPGYFTPTFQPYPMYSPSPLSHSTSPTLAPDYSQKEQLVGLGIGMSTDVETYHTPTFAAEEHFRF